MHESNREPYVVPVIEALQMPAEALCQESTHYTSGLEEVSTEEYVW